MGIGVVVALSMLAGAGPVAGQYTPAGGGWQIRIDGDAARPPAGSDIGVVKGDYRLHRRPLYPPADRTMIWSAEELEKIPRVTFRPLVVAYNEPRFLFDYHAAGGLLGHLYIGLERGDQSKWFHQWSKIDVAYIDGRMTYALRDDAFPGMEARLEASALADSAGLIVRVSVAGDLNGAKLVWAYGGASGFFTNYNMGAKEFEFAPEQCAKDLVKWDKGAFELHRVFDKSDVITNEPFCAWRYLPEWHAVIEGGSSWEGARGFGAPEAFKESTAALAASVTAEGDGRNKVAVQVAPLTEETREGFVVVGMGDNVAGIVRSPGSATPPQGSPPQFADAWARAMARNAEIAGRVVTKTPDPWLDAAVNMMAFATEGTWGDVAQVHGGWSWRFAYLGWRTGYGLMCYGWPERVKKYIESHTTLGLVKEGDDAGALGSMIEGGPGVFYNMNEVFFDHVRQYFDYTNDLELMERIFPVLDGILKWEDKRLQPGGEGLYESALNTWISDSHWYIGGQCTQASAYMLNANRLMASLAARLGKDPAPYQERADKTYNALQQKLWMVRPGVFAEYLDTRGEGMLHPEPELPTIYHSAEFGAADMMQIFLMLDWVDTHLRTDTTPNGGKIVWSSNWYPNHGRTYTHSTYEVAYGEEMNLALTNCLVGRADEAYALIRASLCGIFNGPTPGGLSCHSYSDGRQRANDEFADASSMWARAVVEGIFGINPKLPDGYVSVMPQFPKEWNQASIKTRQFSYSWRRSPGLIEVEWESPVADVRWGLPFVGSEAAVEGAEGASFQAMLGGQTWMTVTSTNSKGALKLKFKPAEIVLPETQHVRQGADFVVRMPGLRGCWDAQAILADWKVQDGALSGVVAGSPGSGVVYVQVGETWLPVKVVIEPALPAPAPKVWKAPGGERDLSRWTLVDLGGLFNSTVVEAPRFVQKNAPAPAMPASQVNFNYWKDHFRETHHGGRIETPSDDAWRAKIGEDGVGWTRDGIPFKSPKEGPNLGVVTVTGGFPKTLSIPVGASGKTLYLMISGITFPNQSHVVNVRVKLRYAGGETETRELVNPFDIGDCWGTWCGRYHDCAANGFENIGGRRGPAGSADVPDLTQPVEVDTEAHLVAFELKEGKQLETVEFEAAANDVIFGIMGATLLR